MGRKGNQALMGGHPSSYTRRPGAMLENCGSGYQRGASRTAKSQPEARRTCKERGRRYVAGDAREIGPVGLIFQRVLIACLRPGPRVQVIGMKHWDDEKRVGVALGATRLVQPGFSVGDALRTLMSDACIVPDKFRSRCERSLLKRKSSCGMIVDDVNLAYRLL